MQTVKDRILVLGVASLITIDLIILVTYILVVGIRGNLAAQRVIHKEEPMRVEGVSKDSSML